MDLDLDTTDPNAPSADCPTGNLNRRDCPASPAAQTQNCFHGLFRDSRSFRQLSPKVLL
ncbi:hypothetical protein PCANC_12220 [Puccinia coronata f. sp. avenae]|uniref:Uncharacterized protein n=1 Tax=Puccinia coronata f. sp. avenae TaxID=200324 RepID=A0A2N5VEX3_9BASI|nr:hypothetical protein PCANC_12220 [Puccinia coronata f. sp. avenae]